VLHALDFPGESLQPAILHSDVIKYGNVLVDSRGHVWLCDQFGCAMAQGTHPTMALATAPCPAALAAGCWAGAPWQHRALQLAACRAER
jgi:hypothetical protein